MQKYASLQLFLDEKFEAAQERIIYTITSYMDGLGYTPCRHESAERTIAFVGVQGGWAIFDDCADRLDIRALNGLARCLTLKLNTRAVGIVGTGSGFMLKLYSDGVLLDTFSTSAKSTVSRKSIKIPGRALRWRTILRKDVGIRELSTAFHNAKLNPDEGFEQLKNLLSLDDSAKYGFSSIEDAKLQGVVWMYFNASNHVRQRWYDKFFRIPTRCGGTAPTAFSRERKCKQKH